MAAFDAIRRISWKILESLAGGGKQDQFVCADQRLCDIAVLEGLAVMNPELTP